MSCLEITGDLLCCYRFGILLCCYFLLIHVNPRPPSSNLIGKLCDLAVRSCCYFFSPISTRSFVLLFFRSHFHTRHISSRPCELFHILITMSYSLQYRLLFDILLKLTRRLTFALKYKYAIMSIRAKEQDIKQFISQVTGREREIKCRFSCSDGAWGVARWGKEKGQRLCRGLPLC